MSNHFHVILHINQARARSLTNLEVVQRWHQLYAGTLLSQKYERGEELFDGVRSIHFLSYIRYLYFNIGRIAYLQANVLSAYVFLAPAIVAGAVTLGVMQQIIRAFGRVEGSMQYILKAWPTIIELASVYKRLREFEYKLQSEEGKSESEFKT